MKTNAAYTAEILSGYLMNNNQVNVGYLAEQIDIFAYNREALHRNRLNTRQKIRNIAINELMQFINTHLGYNGYSGYYATNAQVMKWDKEHENGLEAVLDILVECIETTRNEYKQ